MTNKEAMKRLQSSAEDHPLWFFGGALGAGLLLGKLAPQVVGSLVKLGGGLAWRFLVLPALTERLTLAVEGKAASGKLPTKLSDFDKDRALELVGLTTRPSAAGRLFSSLGLLSAGVVAGAGLGLAFAPRPGSELRRELVERLQKAREEGQPAATLDETI